VEKEAGATAAGGVLAGTCASEAEGGQVRRQKVGGQGGRGLAGEPRTGSISLLVGGQKGHCQRGHARHFQQLNQFIASVHLPYQ